MNIVNILTYLGLLVVLVLIMWGVFYSSLYGSAHSTKPNTPKGLAVTNAEVASYNLVALRVGIAQPLSREHLVYFGEYDLDFTKPPLAIFPEWDSDSAQCARVFLFIENLIRCFNRQENSDALLKQKITYIQNFIDRILPWFNKGNQFVEEVPFGLELSPFSILLPRLLICYLIMIGKDGGSVKNNEVLLLLKRLVSAPNKAVGITYTNFVSVYTTIAYLIQRLVEQPETFAEAKQRQKIADAWDFMNPQFTNNKKLVVNRWYRDLTFCLDKFEFSYTPIVTLVGFYSTLWVGLGLPFSGVDIFRSALGKILHPTINSIPKFAFAGYCDPKLDFRYFSSVSNYGIQIYPSVGVGIYKDPNFYFYIKLVKPNQSLISVAGNISRYEALSTIFSRKMYFTHKEIDITTDCTTALDAVNLIYDSKDNTLPSSIPLKIIGPPDSAGVIGIIDYTMIWVNSYYVPSLVKAQVFEIGIIAKFGIHQYYQIENKGTSTLDFLTPTDTRGNYMYNTMLTSGAKGPITIKPGETSTFFSYQKLSPNVNPELTGGTKDNTEFTFRTQENKYTITFNATEQKLFIQPKNSKVPAMIITDLPDTNTSLVYQGKTYVRNRNNLTFYAQ